MAVTVLGGLGVLAIGTSVYVIYLLEILKLRHLQAIGLFRRTSDEVTQRRPVA